MAKPTTSYSQANKVPTTFSRNRPVEDGLLLIGVGAYLLVEAESRLLLSVGVGDAPDTSYDGVSKNPTQVVAVDKPNTAWVIGQQADGVIVDDLEITLADLDVYLTGYTIYPTPNTLSTKQPTEYQEV